MTPTVSPGAGPWPVGRTRRYAQGCERIRSVRVDAATEAYLAALINVFAGEVPEESVNASILFRRAMQVYYRFVSAMLNSPHMLQDERLRLITNTRKPKRTRQRQTPHGAVSAR